MSSRAREADRAGWGLGGGGWLWICGALFIGEAGRGFVGGGDGNELGIDGDGACWPGFGSH